MPDRDFVIRAKAGIPFTMAVRLFVRPRRFWIPAVAEMTDGAVMANFHV